MGQAPLATFDNEGISQVLAKIFGQPFAASTINGETVFTTAIPRASKCLYAFNDFPQFLYHHFSALKQLDTLGYAYNDGNGEAHYWGIKKSDLPSTDPLLDLMLAKQKTNVVEPKIDEDTEMQRFLYGRRTPEQLQEEKILPPLVGKYFLAMLQGKVPQMSGWEQRYDDDFVFQCAYHHGKDEPIEDNTRFDMRLIASAAALYRQLEQPKGIEASITVLKKPSTFFNSTLVSSQGQESTQLSVNEQHKLGHLSSGLYGFGYHVKGFKELTKFHDALSNKLARQPAGTDLETMLLKTPALKKTDVLDGYAHVDFKKVGHLPLETDQFLDWKRQDILRDLPVTIIQGLKHSAQMERELPNTKNYTP